jgi:para-nitrobenzyl esterase
MYRTALKLSEGGNKVHVLFWNVKPLLENLGSGTVDVASAFFGNSEALQMYGNVLNADLSEILQSFLLKFINGEALNLYNNEIKGVEAVDWKKFPKALIVSNDKLKCEPVADKLTELNSLVDFISQRRCNIALQIKWKPRSVRLRMLRGFMNSSKCIGTEPIEQQKHRINGQNAKTS